MFTVAAGGAGDALAGKYWLEDDRMATWIECDRTTSKFRTGPAIKVHSVDDPASTVMAEGMGGAHAGRLEDRDG
jgi:hypothetical protein